jgi:hypothetical protein
MAIDKKVFFQDTESLFDGDGGTAENLFMEYATKRALSTSIESQHAKPGFLMICFRCGSTKHLSTFHNKELKSGSVGAAVTSSAQAVIRSKIGAWNLSPSEKQEWLKRAVAFWGACELSKP